MEEKEVKQKKIVDFHMIIWYFLIFSIVGLILEMTYGYITMGKWENRQGLIIGPFCPIYGVGAVIFIIVLTKYQNSYVKLFITGAFLGTIVEYGLSYILEAIYGNRFWDYSYLEYNLNGRVSLIYSIFWGTLAILLIKILKPWIDNCIQKIDKSWRRKCEVALYVFFIINALLTVWGVNGYTQRAYSVYEKKNDMIEQNLWQEINEKIFTNDKMKKIFPNLRIYDEEGNAIFIRDIL